MQLRYISVPALIAAAAGDPWAIDKSLQVGRPAQVSDLAEAFHGAGRCTTDAGEAFDEARRRFEAAWNHENGEHPINDAAEVQRVVQSLGAQSLQLPKIGVDLENIAAALAEAQRAASGQIATLEGQLQKLDDLIGQAVELEKDPSLTAEDRSALNSLIDHCEQDAIDDTKAALGQLVSIRNGYSDDLHKSLNNLRTEGYDPAALSGVDSDDAAPPSGQQNDQLRDLRQVTDQGVLDQMAKIRAAQEALNKAMSALYTRGPGSPEGQAAAQSLPKLRADLAHALDDLGKIPDYTGIDPASVSVTPDGHFLFNRTVNGQQVQVSGQLKNGTGEFFDQATGTYYTFNDGKLTGMRTPDPGQVEATPEPLFTAITLAVGGPEIKAGGEAAWQGLKALFTRVGASGLDGLTSENLLSRAMTAAEIRAQIVAEDPLRARTLGGIPVAGTHPVPPPWVGHTPPAGPGGNILVDHPPAAGAPLGPQPVVGPAHPQPPNSPLFDGYRPIAPGPQFARPDGTLIYPDDSLPTRPYAVTGTVVPNVTLPRGTLLERFGYPGGAYLAPDGTPFAELALPPGSAVKPLFQYVVDDPAALPPGWRIEQSEVAPWFEQPGGGQQYRIIKPDGRNGTVEDLQQFGVLRRTW
jgi:Tuberculosis necrotizing toxin